jgi:dynein heavy chain 1
MLQGASGGQIAGAPQKDKSGKKRQSAAFGNWLTDMAAKVKAMLGKLPAELTAMERSDGSLKDPLWRCINRENEVGRKLIKKVRGDLSKLLELCQGTIKTTNDLRALAANISTDSVPKAWKVFVVPDAMTVTEWLADFSLRIEQLELLVKQDVSKTMLWFGGLSFPEAFLTATRQATAQSLQVSLEELQLVVDIGAGPSKDGMSFMVKGLYIEGAKWDTAEGGQLALTDELAVPLPDARLRWLHMASEDYKRTLDYLKLPVYVNGSRTNLLSAFHVRTPKGVERAVWLQRAVCITLWTKR